MKQFTLVLGLAIVVLLANSIVFAQAPSTPPAQSTTKAKTPADMPPPNPDEMKKTGEATKTDAMHKTDEMKKSGETKGTEEMHKAETSAAKTADKIIGKTPDGKSVYLGPKGGQYTLSAKGEKAYLDDAAKKTVIPAAATMDKIVGKTEDGKAIYEGTKGGKYTMNAKGEKVYLKK